MSSQETLLSLSFFLFLFFLSYWFLVSAQNFITIQRTVILQKTVLESLISNQVIFIPVPYLNKALLLNLKIKYA